MDAYIYDAIRTPRGAGKAGGGLSGVRPVALLAGLYRELAARTGVDPAVIDDIVLGCVTQVGEQGANLAKVAALYAGWSDRVPGMTLDRFCASGLDAVNLAAAKVSSGMEDLVVAGGVESMSRVPMMSDQGAWYSDPEVARATGFVHMGVSADLIATLDGVTRAQCDAWALRSHARASAARREGHFARSLVPVRDGSGAVVLERDEWIREGLTAEKLAALPAVFAEAGRRGGDAIALGRYPEAGAIAHVHTVASAPGVVDGAALVLIGNKAAGERYGLRARARVRSYANASVEPVVMLTAPAPATRKALARAGMSIGDVDRYEMNESFSAVVLRYLRELELDADRVNVDGGAIALGHPLGATGAVLLGTLLDALERDDRAVGVVAMCAGAGLGAATVIERV
jgi:acetyl-CoA C-acetyltransferase